MKLSRLKVASMVRLVQWSGHDVYLRSQKEDCLAQACATYHRLCSRRRCSGSLWLLDRLGTLVIQR